MEFEYIKLFMIVRYVETKNGSISLLVFFAHEILIKFMQNVDGALILSTANISHFPLNWI